MTKTTPQERFTLITGKASDAMAEFAGDVKAGLTTDPKRLHCRYFYDHEGSLLFEAICELPEYYLTRTERAILSDYAAEIAGCFSTHVTLVELGSGSATKTRLLLDAFLRQQGNLRYVPIDISNTILEESSLALLQEYPNLTITAVAAEYNEGLQRLSAVVDSPKLILWLGSNIGNFDRTEAITFLQRVRETMTPSDRLLVGIDLRKDREVLEKAYDDAQGVTARFNLNLLARINRELGGHFDLTAFRHRAVYNEEVGRVELYLDSLRDQQISIDRLGLVVSFAEDEAVHTENSYKYSLAEINALAAEAGLRLEQQWLDAKRRFSENLLAPTV